MSNAFDAIASADAAACLAVAKAEGVQIDFTHRAGSQVTIWALMRDHRLSSEQEFRGKTVEKGMITFVIPVQTNFAAISGQTRPVAAGDEIVYPTGGTRVFRVVRESDIDQTPNGKIFSVSAVEDKTLTLGHRG